MRFRKWDSPSSSTPSGGLSPSAARSFAQHAGQPSRQTEPGRSPFRHAPPFWIRSPRDYSRRRTGWDEQVQRAFHDRAFSPRRWQVITAGQAGIGVLDAGYRPGGICLSRIEIDPGHQCRGFASLIVSALAEGAARRGQDLVLEELPARSACPGAPASPRQPDGPDASWTARSASSDSPE